MTQPIISARPSSAWLLTILILAGCGADLDTDIPITTPTTARERRDVGSESIFGPDGLTFGGERSAGENPTGIGVNGYLWRASLSTVSFMPLASADPFGGVILTDWYSPPQTPNERVKVNIFILDRSLRADGVRVSTFRQIRRGSAWVDASVSESTNTALEDAILARARELRVADLQASR